ncbi:uncharacterized protein LOC128551740 [Mercenaria mercenaria]|uniref:uncharacterized protein LOC128551740 n=1 Tax=Mercenaria mercenaria TaxID=6596 RepID=UPI00234E682B|nr:uncharacterized protein LOC128551740 [Mercenaria mercenaria]
METGSARATLVRQLRLYIDENGFIRCCGRIHNAPVDKQTKFPYLLPDKHNYTRLLIQDTHERLLHSGVSSVVTQLRQLYWIPSIRRSVQSVLKKCVACKKVNGRSYMSPDAPPLHKIRVEDAKPFRVTGIDFSGALHVRDRDSREMKAYVCLFTCASTRAVHLELVPDMTTDTFIHALRRFCCRRSVPEVIMSDNATTFHASSRYVHELFQDERVQHNLTTRGIEWKFIPKRAPWHGGWWERLIGLTKETLKKVLGRSFVTYQTLSTVVTEIEAILNDRPLTYVTSDSSDPEPLTPSHLMFGRRFTSLPFSHNDTDNLDPTSGNLSNHQSIIKQARIQQTLVEHFYQRWRREYLTGLRENHQATGNNSQTISVGDVVQIHDETPRTRWRLAVVQQLIPGKDGLFRSAVVKTSTGVTNRPLVKLFPLEVRQENT